MIKKILISLALLFVILVAAVYFFGSGLLNKGIKSGVETFGPKVTQTSVLLDSAHISILTGSGTLKGLYVGNPEGYKTENIFSLGQIDVDLDTGSLLSDTIVIEKIHILKPEISYEKGVRSSNLNDLLANIESFTGGKPAEEAPAAPEEGAKKKVLIKSLIIDDGSLYVSLLGQGAKVPLPRIEMNDIGASDDGKGQSPAEVVQAVIAKILQSVAGVVKNAASIKELGGAVEGATGTLQDAGGAAAEGVNKAAEGIKSLFGK